VRFDTSTRGGRAGRAQDVAALVHRRDERSDVRDPALATDRYLSVALDLLSGGP
jgi:hypothetical protein